jgi:hypothetical protein
MSFIVIAQDLLNSWVKEKTLQTIQPELEFYDEKWASHALPHPSLKVTKQQFSVSDNDASGFGVPDDNHTGMTLPTPIPGKLAFPSLFQILL